MGELGFRPRDLEWNVNPQYVFEHQTVPNTMIILPRRDRNDEVEPLYMGKVLTTLKSHQLLPEHNPLLT